MIWRLKSPIVKHINELSIIFNCLSFWKIFHICDFFKVFSCVLEFFCINPIDEIITFNNVYLEHSLVSILTLTSMLSSMAHLLRKRGLCEREVWCSFRDFYKLFIIDLNWDISITFLWKVFLHGAVIGLRKGVCKYPHKYDQWA